MNPHRLMFPFILFSLDLNQEQKQILYYQCGLFDLPELYLRNFIDAVLRTYITGCFLYGNSVILIIYGNP